MEELIDRIAKAPLGAKLGGIAGLVVIITGLTFLLGIQGLTDNIQRQRVKAVSLSRQLAEKQEIAQNLKESQRELEVLNQQLAVALTKLPEKKDIGDLLTELNDLGRKTGLAISLVEPGNEQPSQFFAKIPIKMSVAGNYNEIAMFLQDVAHMRRIVNVSNIDFKSPKLQSEKVVLQSHFLATTFRFVEKPKKKSKKGGHQ